MRGRAAAGPGRLPEGAYSIALRARGVLVEGDLYSLWREVWLYREAVQWVVDVLWELDGIPSL